MPPQLNSIYRGQVTNNLDPEGFGRLKAIVPQVFGNDSTETDWAWPCYPPGVAGVLNPGAPVLIQFIDGDVNYPVWAGTWLPGYVAPIGPTTPGQIANVQVPVGSSMDWWSDKLPPVIPQITWVFMHGQTLTNAVNLYPQLWAVYGQDPNWAINASDLRVPDTRGRFIQGARSATTETGVPAPPAGAPLVGARGGQQNITLTTTNIPQFLNVSLSINAHTHTVTDPAHRHTPNGGYEFVTGSIGTSTLFINSGGNVDHGNNTNVTYDPTGTSNVGTGISINNTTPTGTVTFGQSTPTAVATMPPWVGVHKILRVA